jgi:NADPH2:quinone reductase
VAEAIVLREFGGPEVLKLEAVDVGRPGPGQLRLRQTAVGVNFHDIYVRSGAYQTLKPPGVPGLEGVGVVSEIGEGVSGVSLGDRVAYLESRYGAYASERLIDASLCVRLPEAVSDVLAGTVMLKGLTAAVLALKVHPLKAGDTVLVHAAAGGVGRLLAQWAAHLGADVIGTAGSPEKIAIAKASGCREVIAYREEPFAPKVMELTGGRGVDVVYDAVGADTFDGSLASLAFRGHLVNYGQASGKIPPFDISRLAPRSASVTRPGYSHYVQTREALEEMAQALFDVLASGAVKAEAGEALPLADAAKAHAALEARSAHPFVLIP